MQQKLGGLIQKHLTDLQAKYMKFRKEGRMEGRKEGGRKKGGRKEKREGKES